MRLIYAALMVLLSAAASSADDLSGTRLTPSELKNVWRTCAVSGRARSTKVRCINEQAEKIGRGRDIQDSNEKAQAATRAQVGVSPDDQK